MNKIDTSELSIDVPFGKGCIRTAIGVHDDGRIRFFIEGGHDEDKSRVGKLLEGVLTPHIAITFEDKEVMQRLVNDWQKFLDEECGDA